MGDILSTVGDVQYCGGYHEYRGVILSTVEGVQYHGGYHPLKFEYHGDIMMHVGDIMSTVGCSVPWGTQITKDFSPHGTEHPPRYS